LINLSGGRVAGRQHFGALSVPRIHKILVLKFGCPKQSPES
jgi:hypothetical protein